MVDRQDIDALLVGALYGELTPAEEARLAAHLESHPADRNALEDLKTARQAVRESQIFELQHEPPQAISAMLLQEAHRRAPKPAREREEKEGWFARLARSFLMHPAMAAAAMLVLVLGVAGTLYMAKGNDESAFKQAESSNETAAGPAPTAQSPTVAQVAPADAGEAQLETGTAQGSAAYDVRLADEADKLQQKLERQQGQQAAHEDRKMLADPEATGRIDAVKSEHSKTPTPHRSAKPPIEVTTAPGLAPKDLEAPKAKAPAAKNGFAAMDNDDAAGPVGGAGGAATGATTPRKESSTVNATLATPPRNAPPAPATTPAPAPPPPPPAAANEKVAGRAPDAKPQAPTATVAAPPKGTSAKSDLISWAQEQLAKAIAYAHDNKCPDAALVTKGILARAPDFYEQNVATNRELKGCLQHINNINEAERAKKASPPKATAIDSAK
jgi:anti-sigma factor RsiW